MNTKVILFALFLSFLRVSAHAQDADPVKKANESNELKADKKIVDEEVAEFLVKSADARMMDAREGKLAKEKATNASLREYGQLMVTDQNVLLKKIKGLAASHHITLPADISNKKEEGREDLAAETGKDFDKKFVKMMIIDHERDVKLFEKAIKCEDKQISAFAKEYLPMIQSHLTRIEALEKTME